MRSIKTDVPMDKIASFCRKWKVVEFSLFGSVLRDDFGPDSDVDVLVTFADDARWSLSHWADMEHELGELFGRAVEVVEKAALRNPFRRHSILRDSEVICAS